MSAMEAKSLVSLTNITAIKGKLEKDLVIFQIKCTLYFFTECFTLENGSCKVVEGQSNEMAWLSTKLDDFRIFCSG